MGNETEHVPLELSGTSVPQNLKEGEYSRKVWKHEKLLKKRIY